MIEESRRDLKFCISARVSDELSDTVAGLVRKAFNEGKLSQCSESMAVNTVFKDVISSEKYWKVQNSILLQNDILMSRSASGSSYVTLSRKQLEGLSESLFDPAPRNRLKAMEYLIRCVFADSSHVISFWEKLGAGLQINLTSPLSVISEASLQVYKKFLVTSTPEVILQVYTSLLNVLGKILGKDFCMLTLSNAYLVADMVHLLNKFQRNVTKHWFRYPITVITGIVSNTFAIYEKCQWLSATGKTGLAHYLWLFDEQALWINSFLCGIVARKEVYQSISVCGKFVQSLMETCQLYLDEELPDENVSCVVQSVVVLLRILERKEGRTCLLLLLSGSYTDKPSTAQIYTTLESIWTLLIAVCVNLFKANEIAFLTEHSSRIMKNQIEKSDSHDQQLISYFFNKMPTYNNPPYLHFMCVCICKVMQDSTSRRFVLNNTTGLKFLLTEMCKSVDCDMLSPILTDYIKTKYIQILSWVFVEPAGALMLTKFEYQEVLCNIIDWTQDSSEEYSNELLNFITTLTEIELGTHILSENEEFVDFYFKNFSIETLLSERNLTLFCMQILSLPLPSTISSEVIHYLMNKLDGQILESICQDSDLQQWTVHLNQTYLIIPFYNAEFLHAFWDDTRCSCSPKNDLHHVLPLPSLSCQNCSSIFELLVLNFSVCDLNFLLYINTQFNLQQLLLMDHLKAEHEVTPILDEETVIKNHVLMRISVIGGSGERSLPKKVYSDLEQLNIINDLTDISAYVLSTDNVLSPGLHNEVNENELYKHFEGALLSNTLSVKDSFSFISHLTINIIELEDQQFSSNGTTSRISEQGIALTLQYGKQQCWLLAEDEENNRKNLSSILNERPVKKHYNFLMAAVFLICGGDLQTSLKFYSLLESNQNKALPVASLFQCLQNRTPNTHRGILCSVFDLMVQKEMPVLFSALKMVHFAPHRCLTLWIGQCFWNVLDMQEIAVLLLLCVFQNGNFLLYACLAILRSLEPSVCNQFEQSELLLFLREYSPKDFRLSDHLQFMQQLNDIYCSVIENELNRYIL